MKDREESPSVPAIPTWGPVTLDPLAHIVAVGQAQPKYTEQSRELLAESGPANPRHHKP